MSQTYQIIQNLKHSYKEGAKYLPSRRTTRDYKAKRFTSLDINRLPKFILRYKIHSKHGIELKTELGPVRRCKLLIICYMCFRIWTQNKPNSNMTQGARIAKSV